MPFAAVSAVAGVLSVGSGIIGGRKADKRAGQQMGLQERGVASQEKVANKQIEMLDKEWADYERYFKPMVAEYSKQTMARAKPDYARLESETTETFGAQADRARAITARAQAASGVDPTSGTAIAGQARIAAAEAPARAHALTLGKRAAEDRAYEAVTRGAEVGKGIPGQVVAGYNGPAGVFGQSADIARRNAEMFNQQAGQAGYVAGRGLDMAIKGGEAWMNRTQPAAPIVDRSIYSGVMQPNNGAYGWSQYAEGGAISGPGDGTSDSISAINVSNGDKLKVSDGEFVMPADVVRWKGEEFFYKLIEKFHRPGEDVPKESMADGGAIPKPKKPGLPKAVMQAIYAEMPSARRH